MDGKFSAIPKEMFEDKRLTALDIAVYAALDSYANSAGEAWPSITVLAERAKVSTATAKRSLSRLEGAGYVVRQRRHMPSSKELDTTLYGLAFRRRKTGQNWPLANHDVSSYGTDAGSDEARVGSDRTKVGSEICCMPAQSVQDVGSEGARNYTHGTITNERDGGGHLPSCVSPSIPFTDTAAMEETLKGVMTHGEKIISMFEELWERYPQKIYKGDAKEAFKALFPDGIPPEMMKRRLEAINERFAILEANAERLIQRGEERYIPSLRNWLAKEGIGDA
jgi:hypothetical protein